MLWRHAHVFPESNQPQRDDAPQRHRCTQTCRSFTLESFHTNTTLEGLMKRFDVAVATYKTLDLVFHAQVDKRKRERQKPSRS